MTALANIADNLKKLLRKSDRLIGLVLKQKSKIIEELNRDQLREGKRSDDVFNPVYEDLQENRDKNIVGEPIKLFDTGDYYKGVKSRVKGQSFELINTDSKDTILRQVYGKKIKGLTPESVNELRIKIQPTLRNETLKLIQK